MNPHRLSSAIWIIALVGLPVFIVGAIVAKIMGWGQ